MHPSPRPAPRSPWTRSLGPVLLGALLAAAPATALAETITVSRSIGFAPGASVRQQIVDECKLQTVIPAAVANSAGNVELVDGKGTLELVISDVHGPNGRSPPAASASRRPAPSPAAAVAPGQVQPQHGGGHRRLAGQRGVRRRDRRRAAGAGRAFARGLLRLSIRLPAGARSRGAMA